MRPLPCISGSNSTRPVYSSSITSNGKPGYVVSSSSTCSQERRQLHTLSVFGGDDGDSGTLINGIAGIFGRRFHNIDSLTLGFINNGLFTVVLVFPATPTVFQQLLSHLNNLPYVLKVEDISTEPQVERELVLIKLLAHPSTRDEIMWLVNIFRAKIVDTSECYMTIEIALRRESMDDCTFSASSCPDLNSNAISSSRVQHDKSRTISMLVNDAPGVLNRVTGIICSRGYKIQSLAVGKAEKEGISRITAIVPGTDESIKKLARRLHKLTEVHEIEDISHVPCVERELMMIKIAANTRERRDILEIANIFRAEAVDLSDHSITLQLTGDIDKMVAFHRLLEPYDIREVARTGRVALVRESGVNSTYLRG